MAKTLRRGPASSAYEDLSHGRRNQRQRRPGPLDELLFGGMTSRERSSLRKTTPTSIDVVG